jgi:hypothetical protein
MSQYLKRKDNYGHSLSKSTNDRVLGVVGIVSTVDTACTMFCAENRVTSAVKRRHIYTGKEITVTLRQNLPMIASWVWLGLCRRFALRALCSARKMQ